MSKFIALWLSAPMMSWGASTRSKYRDTHEFPTISAINGILRASNGVTRDAPFTNEVVSLSSFAFSKTQHIQQMIDYQNVGAAYTDKKYFALNSEGKPNNSNTQTYRSFLTDVKYGVIVEVNDEYNENNLETPLFPIFIGRKRCMPDDKLFIGSFKTKADAIHSIMEKQSDLKLIRSESSVDSIDNECIMKNDVPVTQTKFTSRHVKIVCYE